MEYANGGNLYDFILNYNPYYDAQQLEDMLVLYKKDRNTLMKMELIEDDEDEQEDNKLNEDQQIINNDTYQLNNQQQKDMQQSSNDSNKHHRTLDEFRICNGGVRKISNSSVLLTGTTAEVILKKMAKEREGEWTCRRQMKKKNQRVNTNNINLIGDEIQMKKVKRTRIEEINVQNEQVKYKQNKDIQQEQNDDQYEFFDLERENQSENESEQENDSDIDNCVLA
ncbi:MAG: hypothetical protein EZS28_052892, partial [Streblomastix strix]